MCRRVLPCAAMCVEQISMKRKLANCLWAAGILFWAVPVVFVQGIADLDQLAEQMTWYALYTVI